MKKLLLSNVLGLALIGGAFAQGYTPAPPSGLPDGTVGTAYSQTIDFVIPDSVSVDAQDFGAPVSLPLNAGISSTILAVTGLPNGLSASCDVGNCTYGPGDSGTITISGNPTEGGTFTVAVGSTTDGAADLPSFPPFFAGGLTPFPQPVPGLLDSDDYTMNVAGGGSAVEELDLSNFDVLQNIPNPFSVSTKIKFSAPNPTTVDFKVFDLLGKQVLSNKVNAEVGVNTINFDATSLEQGAYFYSIINGNDVYTKRMIVSGK